MAVGLFATVYFMATYALARHWHSEGLFVPWDFFYDADAGINLTAFSIGGGRYAVTHPFLEMIKVPVLGAGFVVSRIVGSDLRSTSVIFALGVTPLCAALGLIALYGTLLRLKLSSSTAAWMVVAFGFWSSNLAFAPVPETFTISRFFITCLFFVLAAHRPGRWWNVAVIVVGVGIAGTTITNIAIYFIVLAVYLSRTEVRGAKIGTVGSAAAFTGTAGSTAAVSGTVGSSGAVGSAAARAGAVAVGVVVTYFGALAAMGKQRGTEGGPDWLKHFLNFDPLSIVSNILNLFGMFFQMIVAAFPTEKVYGLSFMQEASWSAAVVALGSVGVMAVIAVSRRVADDQTQWGWVHRAALLVIAYNFLLHATFGREMFLYTQHWVVPTFLLLVPAMVKVPRTAALVSLVVAAVNLTFFASIGPEDIPPQADVQPSVSAPTRIERN